MPQYSITLKAGERKRQTFGHARYLTLADLGAASSLDVELEVAGTARESLRGLRTRDRIAVGGGGFEACSFMSAVDCTIDVIASVIDVRLNNSDGNAVQASIVGTVPVSVVSPDPLPVEVSRGDSPANPLHISGAILGDTPATVVTDKAAVAAGPAAAVVLAADPTRLEAVFYNIGPDPVALGMAGITWAKRAIVLSAGDTWIESRGAPMAWYAITDAAKAGSVTVQERKA